MENQLSDHNTIVNFKKDFLEDLRKVFHGKVIIDTSFTLIAKKLEARDNIKLNNEND